MTSIEVSWANTQQWPIEMGKVNRPGLLAGIILSCGTRRIHWKNTGLTDPEGPTRPGLEAELRELPCSLGMGGYIPAWPGLRVSAVRNSICKYLLRLWVTCSRIKVMKDGQTSPTCYIREKSGKVPLAAVRDDIMSHPL